MKKTIFKRPLFVNPQAYTTIPELYSIDKLQSFNFDENDTYTTKLVYNGRVESIIKKAGEEYILHLDLYTVDGSCVLGEWYVKGIDSESVVTIDKNILTIVANNNLKYPGLIAAWSAKGKTNDDVDRNVLKDLTGNEHDIILNNFAYRGMSGYGGYQSDFNTWFNVPSRFEGTVESHKFIITKSKEVLHALVYNGKKDEKTTYKITGLLEGQSIIFGSDNPTYTLLEVTEDGIYEVDWTKQPHVQCIMCNFTGECTITVEIIPEYPDALVFDGVDDYGINENMPILTDYTIIAKRVRLGNYFVVSKYRYDTLQGAFKFESMTNTFSYSSYNTIIAAKESIVFGTSVSYNGQTIKRGLSSDGPVLTLGSMTNKLNFYEGAIYSIYLFNRILPDKEIKSFIRKHIDPEYLLPSEISAITLISNDTLIDNSTLIKNN